MDEKSKEEVKEENEAMSFCSAVNCMDGRAQLPVIEYLRKKFRAEFVDMITEPGPDGLLAQGEDREKINSILNRLEISVKKHDSKGIAVVGHHDCAGNPVDEKTHKEQIRISISKIKERYPHLPVIGLWLDSDFRVHELSETGF